MNEETSVEMTPPKFGRASIFRLLWWILQSIIIGIWKFLVLFVAIWQFLYILFTGKKHAWSREFIRKFINHVMVWTEYIFWVRDERPEII